MELEIAKSAGFCFGVKQALEATYNQIGENKKIYTLGDIIHNESVVSDLKEKGVASVSIDETEDILPSTIIIRSHGVGKLTYQKLEKEGHTIIDATCPNVKKIQKLVREHSSLGEHIVFIGKKNHAETIGTVGWINGNNYTVIETNEEAEKFNLDKTFKLFVVVQTTFNNNKFKEYVEILVKKGYDVDCVDTICPATKRRQDEAMQIAARVDAMIVIGGVNSSNSKELFEICKSKCNLTQFIQSSKDLDMTPLISKKTVGITAGASTPDYIIREVIENVRDEFWRNA